MKTQAKIISTAIAAFVAFSAVAASAGAADQWYTSTTETGTFTTLPAGFQKAIVGTSGVSTLEVPKLGFTIECKKDQLNGFPNISNMFGTEAVIEGAVLFTECQIKGTSTAVCQVRSKGRVNGQIQTNALTGVTNTSTGANKGHMLFAASPGAAAPFAEVEILGEECAFLQARPQTVFGSVEGVLSPAGNTAARKLVLEFPSTSLPGTSIIYGGNPAKFKSTETAELISGEWIVLK